MAQLRWINTRIWSADEYFPELTVDQKLMFLYLLTNSMSNIIGVYELPLRTASNETGIPIESIKSIIEKFSRDGKVHYISPCVIIENFRRHQNNDGVQTQKGILNSFNLVPCRVVSEMVKSKYATHLIALVKEYSQKYKIPVSCLENKVAAQEVQLEIIPTVREKDDQPGPAAEKPKTDYESECESLLAFWLAEPQKLSKRGKVTSGALLNYKKLRKDYSPEEIKSMIEYYSIITNDPKKVGYKYSWAGKWSFELFLTRGYKQFVEESCLSKFIDPTYKKQGGPHVGKTSKFGDW